MEQKNVHISADIVFKSVIILLSLWFLYITRDIIVLLFMSVILVSAMEPAVDWLQKKKIPRSVTVLGIYLLLLIIISLSISLLIPPLVKQIQELAQNSSQYSQKLEESLGPVYSFIQANHINLGTSQLLGEISNSVSSFTSNIFTQTIGIFSGLVSAVIVFSMAFYMSVEENGIKNFIVSVVPKRHQHYAESLTERIKTKIGRWLLAQLLVMLIIFILDAIGLYIVKVPYALILGIFSGFMEIVPFIGPVIAAIPGVILGFTISPTVGFLALAVYVLAQQFESNVVVPIVMKKTVGLNPIAVILALLIGARLGGMLGVILSIPVATAIGLVIKDFMDNKNEKQTI